MKEEQRLILIKPADVSKFDIRLLSMVARRRNKVTVKDSRTPVNPLNYVNSSEVYTV